MRVLLDENLDVQLKSLFDPSFQVVTVRDRRWRGIKNGALLRDAEAEFDVLVTMDKKLRYQQDLSSNRLGIVVIRAQSNAFRDVSKLMPEVNAAIRRIQPGQIIEVRDAEAAFPSSP